MWLRCIPSISDLPISPTQTRAPRHLRRVALLAKPEKLVELHVDALRAATTP